MILAKMAKPIQTFYQSHKGWYAFFVFIGCFFVYFAVLELFLRIPILNDDIQVRIASGLGPALSLFFGVPGILGCSIGNLASDAIWFSGSPDLGLYFIIQIIYNSIPYVVWYTIFYKRSFPYPRLGTPGRVTLYLGIAIADAIIVSLLLYPLEDDFMQVMNINLVHVLNNILFLIYVGLPVLLLLDFSPLIPFTLRKSYEPYKKQNYIKLTQYFVLVLLVVTACVIALFIIFGYGPYFAEEDTRYNELIASIYFMAVCLTLAIFIPMMLVARYFEKNLTRPLEVLSQASGEFASQVEQHMNDSQALMDLEFHKDLRLRFEVRELFEATNKMRTDIVHYVDTLSMVTAERERTAAELDIARQIQMGAVPHDFSSFKERYHVDIEAYMRPAREVGGDFYDVFDMGNGRIGFVIGDVSGKGVPAALFMMRSQSLLKQFMLENSDVGTAFTLANRRLCERNDALLFVTAFACVLDTATGHVEYANAGHNPPSLCCDGKRVYLKTKPGLVLGMMDTVRYCSGSLELCPGDGLVLYTDGVTEATDASDNLYGEERLACVLEQSDKQGKNHLEAVVADVDAFACDVAQFDDITLLDFSWDLAVQRLVLDPDSERLDDLFDFLEPFCCGSSRTKKMHYDLMLVCEEAFVNICHYGFPDDHPRLPVIIEATLDEKNEELQVTLSDQGIAYNPLGFEPERVGYGKDNKIGGLGILLMREYTDGMQYERIDGRNILRITKKFI